MNNSRGGNQVDCEITISIVMWEAGNVKNEQWRKPKKKIKILFSKTCCLESLLPKSNKLA